MLIDRNAKDGNSSEDAKYIRIFGIKFLVSNYQEVMTNLQNGGLMVVPSAPSLLAMEKDKAYSEAMCQCDVALPDSGLMVFGLRVFKGVKLSKLSGLKFLREFLQEEELKEPNRLFLVDPSDEEREANHNFLVEHGITIHASDHYVAPMYGKGELEDNELLHIVESKKPKYILINLGGGIQEKLGAFLKLNLSYRPAIICTGAAIAFLTGKQANIPEFIDRLYLGWLARCLSDPKRFVPRYLKSVLILPLIWNSSIRLPPVL